MIYMVDHIFADPALEPAWHEWYSGYLRKLVSVPGIHTAQRFKAIGHAPSRYLAMYSIDSADNAEMAALTSYLGFDRAPDKDDASQVVHSLWLAPSP